MALGDNCRSSCMTKDHESFGACARSAHISTQWLGGASGHDYGDEKAFFKENAGYAQAVRDGLNPTGVGRESVERAYREAEG